MLDEERIVPEVFQLRLQAVAKLHRRHRVAILHCCGGADYFLAAELRPIKLL